MDLQTTPFSKQELGKKYELSSFEELGISINVQNEITKHDRKLPSGNCYKFGVITNGDYFWYFGGDPVKKIQNQKVDRTKAREIYSILVEVNKNTNNIPFIFKVK
jgi:hypothetical protein